MNETAPAPRLRDLPLWRLLVALADAERALGPTHAITKRIAAATRERLAEAEADSPHAAKGGGRGC